MKRFSVLVFAIAGLLVGAAYGDKPKGYSVTLTEGSIGGADIDSGQYKVLIHRDEMKAELQDEKTGDLFEVTGKVAVADSKFDHTEILSRRTDGVNRITEIRIGGTTFRVEFQTVPAQ